MKRKSIAWGIVLIVLAVYLVTSSLDLIPHLPIFKILFTLFMAYICVKGILKINFFEIIMPLALLGCVYDDVLGITEITPWILILAAFLVSVGLDMIFKNFRVTKHVEIEGVSGVNGIKEHTTENGMFIKVDCAFGNVSKYIDSDAFSGADIDAAFGQCNVYFDNAVMASNVVSVKVDNSFGQTNLYFPATWRMDMRKDSVFGNVVISGNPCTDLDAPLVHLDVENAFGQVNLYFN